MVAVLLSGTGVQEAPIRSALQSASTLQDLARREAEMTKRENEMAKREAAVRHYASTVRNWPKCFPVIHHNPEKDLPPEKRGLAKLCASPGGA